MEGSNIPRLASWQKGILFQPKWRVFGFNLEVRGIVEGWFPAVMSHSLAMEALLNQILQKLIVDGGLPVAKRCLVAIKVFPSQIRQKKGAGEESV